MIDSMKVEAVTPENVLEVIQERYMTPDDAGIPHDSREGGYQTEVADTISSDDLVDALLTDAGVDDAERRTAMISALDTHSMLWVAR